ncbi:MAG: hypothetical protein AAFY25_10340 [Pseudomonadota bacterium]
MAINMVLRRVMRTGIDAGMNAIANRKKGQTPDAPDQPRQAAPDTRKTQQRMRKSMRLGRRIGRF